MTDAKAIVRHHDAPPNENPWVHGNPPTENIEVIPYDSNWPAIFQRLEREIKAALGNTALSIEHVGSTAVPGLAAKPVIDIDLTVADTTDEASYAPQLEKLGYDLYIREPSWHQHRCFRLAEPRVNLHVFGPDCPEVIRHRMFREWLKSHPDDRELYEQTKLDAVRGASDVTEYNARKQPVIREIYERMFKAAGLQE
ncbi:GrpB family protein [Synergistaceae bacterium OttesenSCG-928-I11]|nr:GrpB family protein [Synergistaceae bacterium OttesenSCG-928-I11]